jgi:hypothetical protein
LTIPGYNLEAELRRDRHDTGQGVGGGLIPVVYARSQLQVLPIDKYRTCKFNQFCAFKLPSANLDITLVYRPPNSGQENSMELCQILESMQEDTILIGDINMPGINWTGE